MPLVGGHIVLDESATHGFHCLPAKKGGLEDMMVDDSRKDGYKNDNSHLLCSLRVYFEGRVLHVASALSGWGFDSFSPSNLDRREMEK